MSLSWHSQITITLQPPDSRRLTFSLSRFELPSNLEIQYPLFVLGILTLLQPS